MLSAIEELIILLAFGTDDAGRRNALIGMQLDGRMPRRLGAMRRHLENPYSRAFGEQMSALLTQAPPICATPGL